MRSPALAAAFASVPRELFLPPGRRDDALLDAPVCWQGESCASQPTVVARMLEQLDVRPGMHVLEIGAATGFNAALMACLAGRSGRVTTVELDPGMAAVARANLEAAGISGVRVAAGDGADRFTGDARYDRVIWTCATWALPPHPPWWLANGGRVVAPLVLPGNVQKALTFTTDDDGRLHGGNAQSVQFVVQRGAADRTAQQARPLPGGWTLWREDVDAAGVMPETWTGPVTATAVAGLQAGALALVVEAATWLAVTDPRACSVQGPAEAAHPPALARSGARLPRGTGVGLAADGALALAALGPGGEDGDAAQAPVVVLGFGDAGALAGELEASLRRWASRPGREVTAQLEADVDSASGAITPRLAA